MGASKGAKEVWITFNGKRRQVKPCGIREPKDRVKGYRVEIRPPNSKAKIWVGTFATRTKAQRAFDTAIYLIGKQPYYHIYPGNFFPRRPSLSNFEKLKGIVQTEAKKYAEKNGALEVNPLSLILDTSPCAPQVSTIPEPAGSRQPTIVDRQVIFPTEGNLTNIVEEVDAESLELTEQEEFDNSSQTLRYYREGPEELASDALHDLEDLEGQESKEDDETMVPAAYLRGLNAPNPASVVNALLDYPPADCFNVFPHIQGGDSILDVFVKDSSLKLIPIQGEHDSPVASAAQFPNWSTFPPLLEDDGRLGEAFDDHPMEDGGVELECSGYLAGYLTCYP